MSHFNVKTLSFYAIAIGSVLLLFKVVSTYGETKLNAAPNIDGSYQFAPVANLPDCLQGKQLNLNIEQSGVYLFGHLAVQPPSKAESAIKIPLSGDFQDNQVVMSGKGNVPSCDSGVQLTIQGKQQNHDLVGQIKDDLTQKAGAFVAQYQQPKIDPESAAGH